MGIDKRNNILTSELCKVYLKSVKGNMVLPDFQDIYGTPSKIRLSFSSSQNKIGPTYDYKLSLMYPGLSETDFETFNKMLLDRYQVEVKTVDHNYMSLSSKYFPFVFTTSFSNGSGTELIFKAVGPVQPKQIYLYADPDYVLGYFE